MIIKESFIQVMLNSTPKTMTKKQKCREKKEKKTEKSAKKKVNKMKKKLMKGYKKWPQINTLDYLIWKKIRKENTQKIGTRKCLRKTNKN